MIYLLDANTFIQAKNLYYRMSVCPGFWDWIDQSCGTGQVFSIDGVYGELLKGKDPLSDWAKERKDYFLSVDDDETQACFADIASYVQGHSVMSEPHVGRFLSGADPWLVAKAKTTGATLVTHEVAVSEDSKKVKVPNVCREFGVDYCDTFDLMEVLKANLVLGK